MIHFLELRGASDGVISSDCINRQMLLNDSSARADIITNMVENEKHANIIDCSVMHADARASLRPRTISTKIKHYQHHPRPSQINLGAD